MRQVHACGGGLARRGARGDRECWIIHIHSRSHPGPATYPVPTHPRTRALALHRHATPRPCTHLPEPLATSSSSTPSAFQLSTKLTVPSRGPKKKEGGGWYTVQISYTVHNTNFHEKGLFMRFDCDIRGVYFCKNLIFEGFRGASFGKKKTFFF